MSSRAEHTALLCGWSQPWLAAGWLVGFLVVYLTEETRPPDVTRARCRVITDRLGTDSQAADIDVTSAAVPVPGRAKLLPASVCGQCSQMLGCKVSLLPATDVCEGFTEAVQGRRYRCGHEAIRIFPQSGAALGNKDTSDSNPHPGPGPGRI